MNIGNLYSRAPFSRHCVETCAADYCYYRLINYLDIQVYEVFLNTHTFLLG